MGVRRRRSLTGRLLAPGIRLLGKLRMRARMGTLALILGLPLICETALILHSLHQQRSDAELEALGAPVVAAAFPCVERALELRGLVSLKESGNGDTAQAEKAAREALRAATSDLEVAVRGANLAPVSQEWQAVQQLLLPAIEGKVSNDRLEAFAQYSRISEALRHLIRTDAEASGLLLDPEGPSFHLMQLAIEPMIPWMDSLGQIHAGSTAILSNGDGSIQDQIELRKQLARLDESLDFAETIIGSLERSGEAAPDGLKAAIQNARRFGSRTAAMVAADRIDGDLQTHFKSGVQAITDATAAGNVATRRLSAILAERSHRLERDEHVAFALCAFGLFASAYLAMAMLLSVFRNVRELVKAVDSLGVGDFTARMRVQGADELATVGGTLESVMARLSTMIADVRSNAVVVTQSGMQLGDEIHQLSVRTESQAASLQQTTASVQEISVGVRRGAQAAEDADAKATRVRERAEAGKTSIAAVVTSMEDIRRRSQRVQEIVGVIEGLAFQTNLLALNAAVEAARAGEQGRGFNVVATEVRALAQRSAQSAREINGLISEAVASVQTGVQQVQDANETFVGIVEGIHAVAHSVSDIRQITVSQSHNLDQVAQAVGTIDSLTQENARMVDSAFNTSSNLAQRASLLGDGIGALRLRQGGADEAFELVKRAQDRLKARGRSALEEITRDGAEFVDRDMYVFAFDRGGTYRAFAGDPARVGSSVRDVPGVDADKLISDAFETAAHGGGWVDYKYANPTTGATDLKTSYVVAFEKDLVVGCGVYKMRNV